MKTVGVAELRQNLSKYLRRVDASVLVKSVLEEDESSALITFRR